jgi:hypothetical protein
VFAVAEAVDGLSEKSVCFHSESPVGLLGLAIEEASQARCPAPQRVPIGTCRRIYPTIIEWPLLAKLSGRKAHRRQKMFIGHNNYNH